jgi:hypothetical protein
MIGASGLGSAHHYSGHLRSALRRVIAVSSITRVPQSRDCAVTPVAHNGTYQAVIQMFNPSSNRRLQLATRIHYALMRELGHGVDVGRLLKNPLYARDVLFVCDACTGNDLPRLAKAFRGAMQEAIDAGASGTSTFGLSSFRSSQVDPASQASVPGTDFAQSEPTH